MAELAHDLSVPKARRKRRKIGAAPAILFSVFVHVLIAFLIWKTKAEPRFKADVSEAISVALARSALPPAPVPEPPKAHVSAEAASASAGAKAAPLTTPTPSALETPTIPSPVPPRPPAPASLPAAVAPAEPGRVAGAGGDGSARDQGAEGKGFAIGRAGQGVASEAGGGGGGVVIGGDCAGGSLYLTMIMSQLRSAFIQHEKGDSRPFHVQARLWFNGVGALQRVQFVRSTGDPNLDKSIGQLLAEANVGTSMPQCLQPFNVSINAPWDGHVIEQSGDGTVSTTWRRGSGFP